MSKLIQVFGFARKYSLIHLLFIMTTGVAISSPRSNSPYRRTSTSLGAGRARRFSSSGNSNVMKEELEQKNSQQQDKLIEKEELARRRRIDQMNQRLQKAVRREERIMLLESKLANGNDETVTDAERAELGGLLQKRDHYEETYDPEQFTEEHLHFKACHNDVFAQLVRYCEKERVGDESETDYEAENTPTRVFFLDGPDGGTASSLINKWNFDPSECFVANRHESTCLALKQQGILPEENVAHATASEALTKGDNNGAFAQLDFMGYYFDGCAGYAPHIINMMSSALLMLGDHDDSSVKQQQSRQHPIVVGYSLLGGNKNLIEKELKVSRALTIMARSRGMRIVHALDDPSRFGIDPSVPKLGGNGGNTFTTWLVLEQDKR